MALGKLQGEMVSLLVNEYQTTGKHSVMFDCSGLPSGIYYDRQLIVADALEADKNDAGEMRIDKHETVINGAL